MAEKEFDQKRQEQFNEQKSMNKFDNAEHKGKPKNQNQQHNIRREAIGPVNQQR